MFSMLTFIFKISRGWAVPNQSLSLLEVGTQGKLCYKVSSSDDAQGSSWRQERTHLARIGAREDREEGSRWPERRVGRNETEHSWPNLSCRQGDPGSCTRTTQGKKKGLPRQKGASEPPPFSVIQNSFCALMYLLTHPHGYVLLLRKQLLL